MPGRFSIEAIFTATDRLTRPMVKMTTHAERLQRTFRGFSSGLRGFDRQLSGMHTMLKGNALALGGLGLAGGVVAKNIFDAGAGFEQAMSAVAAVSLVTQDQIKDLRAEALRLGKDTKFTATEVANAMEEMGRAGFSNAGVLKGVGGVLAAAAADGMEIADAAAVISSAIKGMGLDVEKDTGRVANVLALASAQTKSSISTLGESLANVAATARQFSVPFESTVAAVALLQDVGLDASVAGTSLNTMLTKLATPTEAVRAQMRALGVEFQDAKGNMLPFEQVLSNVLLGLRKSGGNLQQAGLIADLFGMYGQKAAANLAQLTKSGDFEKLVMQLEEATNEAEQMAALRMDNVLGDVEMLTGELDGLKLALFDMEQGPLRKVIQGWTQWLEANRELILSKTAEFLVGLKTELPNIVKWVKRAGIAISIFYGVAAAVKVARVATAAFQLTLGAYTLVAKLATLATARFGGAARASASAAAAGEAASKAYAAALGTWTASSTAATASASTLTGKLGKLGGLLGKAGILGAVGLIGYEFGTWLDKTTGISERIAKWLADLTGVNDELHKADRLAKERTGQPVAPVQETSIGARFLDALAAGASGGMHAGGFGSHGSFQAPQVVTSSSSSTSNEKVEVTIKDETGRAEVKRKAPPSGSRVKVTPSGRF